MNRLTHFTHFHNIAWTPDVIPAQAGIQNAVEDWTPAFAGVTVNHKPKI
jgi:hypothetical protein